MRLCKHCGVAINRSPGGKFWFHVNGELRCYPGGALRAEPAAPEAEPRTQETARCNSIAPGWKVKMSCVKPTGHSGNHEDCHGCWWPNYSSPVAEPPAVPPAQPEAIAHNAFAMPHQNCTGPCCRPDLWEAGIKGRGPQKDVPPAQERPATPEELEAQRESAYRYGAMRGGQAQPSPQPASGDPDFEGIQRIRERWNNAENPPADCLGSGVTPYQFWLENLLAHSEKQLVSLQRSHAALRESQQERVEALKADLEDFVDLNEYWNGGNGAAVDACQHTCEISESASNRLRAALANAAKLEGE